MRLELEQYIKAAVESLFSISLNPELSRPEPSFGDYTTNVPLRLSKELQKPPHEIAELIVIKLKDSSIDLVDEISIAGPGFINFKLSDKSLINSLSIEPSKSLDNQQIVIEYSDPNPFKVLHAGHLYTTIVGDAIANLLEAAGATVHRVNYGGDVGLHVAKTMWAIKKRLGGEHPEKLNDIAAENRSSWLADAYVEGNNEYEENPSVQEAIKEQNKIIYGIVANDDHESPLGQIYWTTRRWSYEAFDAFYARLGTHMERYYPESSVADKGLELVKSQIGKTFEESEGAVIFDGDKFGLHTRVFINQQGLPTYEAKELGLFTQKYEDYHYDKSIIITANEQAQYMAVVFKAIEQFMPELVKSSVYIPHGMVRLSGNVKMSSRKGNIIKATEVIDMTADAAKELVGKEDVAISIGAIKYAFLRPRLGGDVVYDSAESVSIEGNSGPYIQYAHARARSILTKASYKESVLNNETDLEGGERNLLRKINEYPEVVDESVNEYLPHHICTYLYELSQEFNRFYEHNRVIGDPRQEVRLILVDIYSGVLKKGLGLLGIEAPQTM